MRITIIHSFYSARVPSGENLMVLAQIQALNDCGHEVSLISSHSDDTLNNPYQKVIASIRVSTGFGKSPLESINDFAPDLVIVNNMFPNFATSWLGRVKVPKIYILHNYRLFCATGLNFRDGHQCFDCTDKNPLSGLIHSCYRDSKLATLPLTISQIRRPFINNELDLFDGFVALSQGAKSILMKQGLPEDKISVIPNFIEYSKEMNVVAGNRNNGRWVATGRLSREKGFLNLVKNWPDGIDLDIIGNGPDEIILEKIVEKRPNIRLLGHMQREEVMTILPNYLGAIHPSLWQEVCPLTVIEYLSSGLPVITLATNTSSNLISEEKAGIVISEFSSSNLLGAIKKIGAFQDEYSKSAHRTFLDHFTKDIWIDRMNSLFSDLVKKN